MGASWTNLATTDSISIVWWSGSSKLWFHPGGVCYSYEPIKDRGYHSSCASDLSPVVPRPRAFVASCRQLWLGLATHKNQMVTILPGLLAMMLHLASSEHKMEWFENVLDESVFEATVINSVVSTCSLQRVHYNMHVPISARNQEN